MVLSEKAKQQLLVVVESMNMEKPKTKDMSALIHRLPAGQGSRLVVNSDGNAIFLAARNIKKTGVSETRNLHVADVLQYQYVIISKQGIQELENALSVKK